MKVCLMMQLNLIHCIPICLVLVSALSETAASDSSCFICPTSVNRRSSVRSGKSFAYFCDNVPSNQPNIYFYLNDNTQPLDPGTDSNLVYFPYNNLKVNNVTPAYEGVVSCQFEGGPITPHTCLKVLGIARFVRCTGSGCMVEVNATAGENVTLQFDIVYENGGCENQWIRLGLLLPGSAQREFLNPGSYMYNSVTKTRHVQKTLVHVDQTRQGLYRMTMNSFNNAEMNVVDSTTTLDIRLNVRDPPATPPPTTPPPMTLPPTTPPPATTPPPTPSTIAAMTTGEVTTNNSTHTPATGNASTTTAVMTTITNETSAKPVPLASTPGVIIACVVVVGVVVIVVVIVLAILIKCKQSKTTSKAPIPETNVFPNPNPDRSPSRKQSSSTTTESNASSNMPNLDTTNSVGTLETEETVQPQEHLQVGNGAPPSIPPGESDCVDLPGFRVSFRVGGGGDGELGRCSRRLRMPNMDSWRNGHHSSSTSYQGGYHPTEHFDNQLDNYARERLETWCEDQENRRDSQDDRTMPEYDCDVRESGFTPPPCGRCTMETGASTRYCAECRNLSTNRPHRNIDDCIGMDHGLSRLVERQHHSEQWQSGVLNQQRTPYYCKRTDSVCSTGRFSINSSPDDYNNASLPSNLPSQIIHV